MNEDYMFEDEEIKPEKAEFSYHEEPEQPSYSQPNENKQGIGLAVASFICGIVSLVFFITVVNLLPAIIAIILGIIFLVIAKEKRGKGLAIIGIITGLLAIVLLIISCIMVFSNINNIMNIYGDSYYLYNIEGTL